MNAHSNNTRQHPAEAAARRILSVGGVTLLASVGAALGVAHLLLWRGAVEIFVVRLP